MSGRASKDSQQFLKVSPSPIWPIRCLVGRKPYSINQSNLKVSVVSYDLAHAVIRAPELSLITPSLRSLHWLKIKERIDYTILSLSYKVLTATKPSVGHPSGTSEGLKLYRWTLFLSFLFLSIHCTQQLRSGWPSNVFRRFGYRQSFSNWSRDPPYPNIHGGQKVQN